MSQSLTKIWVHAVFSTKHRAPFLVESLTAKLFPFIRVQLQDKHCFMKAIGGVEDHIHILFLLNQNISLADLIKQIKGSSAHWVNQNDLTSEKFSWQTGYGAFSVSESQLEILRNYIASQKEHHAKNSFSEEYEKFLNLHSLKSSKDG